MKGVHNADDTYAGRRFTEPTDIANRLVAKYAEPEKMVEYVDCGQVFHLPGSSVS